MRILLASLLLLAACPSGGGGEPELAFDSQTEFCPFVKWVDAIGDTAYFRGFTVFAKDGEIVDMVTDWGPWQHTTGHVHESSWSSWIGNWHKESVGVVVFGEDCTFAVKEPGTTGWVYNWASEEFFFNP